MDYFKIRGGRRLSGKVKINGAKNAALPIIAASLLSSEKSVLNNIPDLADIRTMLKLVNIIGAETEYENSTLKIMTSKIKKRHAPYELVRTMRASIYAMGPLLAREGHCTVAFPGGCSLGVRPIDIHLKGFEKLGVKFKIDSGLIEGRVKKLKGSDITFDLPSVGATANIIMAAVLAQGETRIMNYAMEPEIMDLVNYLNECGAKIKVKPDLIHIGGVNGLKGTEYSIIPDRIELGTFGVAGLITGGEVLLEWGSDDLIGAFSEKLSELGAEIRLKKGIYHFRCKELNGDIDVKTMPYPGFATDLQPILGALCTINKGNTVIYETIFENRFMWVPEITRMGAKIKKDGNTIIISGAKGLQSAPVMASDIRSGAALLLAGLCAKGETILSRVYHIDRGYEKIEERLNSLGADILRER